MSNNGNNNTLEKRLWTAADELRANSKLKSNEYSVPVLGLVFLRFADFKFEVVHKELEGAGSGRRTVGPADYQAKGVLYLPEKARFSQLVALPEGDNIGAAINDAMRAVVPPYQEELSHFPQKPAFYASENANWRFQVPGRTVTKSTSAKIRILLAHFRPHSDLIPQHKTSLHCKEVCLWAQ